MIGACAGAGDTYILTNVGTATAHAVALSADESLMVPDGFPETQDLRPDDAVRFTAVVTMATRDRTITVEWSSAAGEGEQSTWRYPLPPRS